MNDSINQKQRNKQEICISVYIQQLCYKSKFAESKFIKEFNGE
jgi:hypothetical protein